MVLLTSASIRPMSRRSSRWYTDVRLFIGVVLVVASVGGVWAVIASARITTHAVVAERLLLPGDSVGEGDVRTVEVGLAEITASYVRDIDDVVGRSVTRPVAAGELVPLAATDRRAPDTTSVVVNSAAPVPAGVAAGHAVDLWTTSAGSDDEIAPPRILVAGAIVAAVEEPSSSLSSAGPSVEIVVPRSSVADVLAAQTAGDTLSVIPAGGR